MLRRLCVRWLLSSLAVRRQQRWWCRGAAVVVQRQQQRWCSSAAVVVLQQQQWWCSSAAVVVQRQQQRWCSCAAAPQSSSILSLLRDKPLNQIVKINGWVKGLRRQKERTFIDVDDGSCIYKLQVVLSSEKRPADLGFHAAVSVTGVLRSSSHERQDVELVADDVQVVGSRVHETYPFKARKVHVPEYVRQYPHLRARTSSFASLLRVRSQTKMAIHQYLQKEGFVNVDTPVLTTNDCEGGGEVFTVQHLSSSSGDGSSNESNTSNSSSSVGTASSSSVGTASSSSVSTASSSSVSTTSSSSASSDASKMTNYFGRRTHLTVSGQLHLEALACGLWKVYTINPAFRAENANTRRHLAEFWMVEVEEAFVSSDDHQEGGGGSGGGGGGGDSGGGSGGGSGLHSLMDRLEALVKTSIQSVIDARPDDIAAHWSKNTATQERVMRALDRPFTRLSYTEALTILEEQSASVQGSASVQSASVQGSASVFGSDLSRDQELRLTRHLGDTPVILTHFPAETKPFYMCHCHHDPKLVLAVDLLLPGVGEVAGGGVRENNVAVLHHRLQQQQLLETLGWYLELRRLGGCPPTAGFGLGFERLLQFMLGISNIKDTIAFPRWSYHCLC